MTSQAATPKMRTIDESHEGWLHTTYYVQIVNTENEISETQITTLLRDALVSLNEEVVIIDSNVYTNDSGTYCHSKFPLYKSASGNYLLIRDWFEGSVIPLFEKVCKVLSQRVKLVTGNGDYWTFRRDTLRPFYHYDCDEFVIPSPLQILEATDDDEKILSAVTHLRPPIPEHIVDKLMEIVAVPEQLKVKSPFLGEYVYHGLMEKSAMYDLLEIGEYCMANEDTKNLTCATLVLYKSWEGKKNFLEFTITYAESTYNGFSTIRECIESLIGEYQLPKYRSIRRLLTRREALKRVVENKDYVVLRRDVVNDIIEFDNDIVMNRLANEL
jgi:hypothetical protein